MEKNGSTNDAKFSLNLKDLWGKGQTASPVTVRVGKTKEKLTFSFSNLGEMSCVDPSQNPATPVEGLWRKDCLEIFVSNSEGRYLEINATPQGHWWMCFFSSPRVREGSIAEAPTIDVEGDTVTVAVNYSTLQKLGDLDSLSWNATAILGHPETRYLSAAALGGAEPDFHRPTEFLAWPVEFKKGL